ncbi:MAG: hypothetical protein IK121_05600 [Lachnospiraceae bacterium]|nr:hypothetical protein [Lachnospiraceae bacterium]MBR5356375.1 hypothetical protein [Lachnospiraceae bacterium]
MYSFDRASRIRNKISGLHISIVLFIALFVFFLRVLGNVKDDSLARQEESLKTALNRSIVSCYCVEGTYPPSLKYIKDHYGLTYDEDVFFVDYQAIGANIYPDVTVLRKEEQ